jgi:regulator of RNase E activity RraA
MRFCGGFQVHVVRARPSAGEEFVGRIYALKIMSKDHVKTTHQMITAKAERDVLVDAYNQ